MAALTEPVVRQYRLSSVSDQRAYPIVVAATNTLFQGAAVCYSTAGGTVEIPAAAALKAMAGVVVEGPANGDASYAAGDTAMVSRGGEVLLTITDVLVTTNGGVPVYAISDNDFTITKPASAVAIIGHITQVTAAGQAWVLLDLAEVNP